MFRGMACFALGALLLAVTAGSPVFGQDKDKEKVESTPNTPEMKAASSAAFALRLAEVAREKKSPEGLILAARILGTVPTRKLADTEKLAEKAEVADLLKLSEKMLAEAQKMDGANEHTMKTAEAAKKEIATAERPVIGGPRIISGNIGPDDKQDTYMFRAQGRTTVRVVNPQNRGDIDLRVEDDNGRVLFNDRRTDDDAFADFNVGAARTIYVKVRYFKGPGRLYYTLITN